MKRPSALSSSCTLWQQEQVSHNTPSYPHHSFPAQAAPLTHLLVLCLHVVHAYLAFGSAHDFKVHASYLADLRQQLQSQHQSDHLHIPTLCQPWSICLENFHSSCRFSPPLSFSHYLFVVVDVRLHVQQSEKLAVALKFIDWFTESKLAME